MENDDVIKSSVFELILHINHSVLLTLYGCQAETKIEVSRLLVKIKSWIQQNKVQIEI